MQQLFFGRELLLIAQIVQQTALLPILERMGREKIV